MCIAFIKKENNQTLLAFNRDEQYARSHSSLTNHPHEKKLYGQDFSANGTWLALDYYGRFSFVTNIRKKEHFKEHATSRGEIPFKRLANENISPQIYNPFNSILFDGKEIHYINYLGDKLALDASLFGITNGVHPNEWDKVKRGKAALANLSLEKEDLFEHCLAIMQDETKSDTLPEGTGFDQAQEYFLSSIFLKSKDYGTVSTTLALIDKSDIFIREINYINKTDISFKITKENL